jgi:hypothetical protein
MVEQYPVLCGECGDVAMTLIMHPHPSAYVRVPEDRSPSSHLTFMLITGNTMSLYRTNTLYFLWLPKQHNVHHFWISVGSRVCHCVLQLFRKHRSMD